MTEKTVQWLLFLINPFLSLIFVLVDYSKPHAKNIFWGFCAFFGFTFAIGFESSGADINRYISQLEFMYDKTSFSLTDLYYFYLESGEIDFFNIIVTYFISRFSNSPSILLLVYGLFFGYFYSRNIWYVMEGIEGKLSISIRFLLISLVLVVPVWYINGIRMYLAFHVFIYGLLPYIFENKRDKLTFLYASILIHFSFSIPILVFIIYRFLGNRIHIYFLFFILSLLTDQTNLSSSSSSIIGILPQRVYERSESYVSEDIIEQRRNQSQEKMQNWYVKWYIIGLKWALSILIIYFYFFRIKLIYSNSALIRLFSLALLFFISANFLHKYPSGSRFFVFPFFLTLVFFINYMSAFKGDLDFKKAVNLLAPVFILFIIISFRISLYSVSLTTLVGNPIFALFSMDDFMSLNDFIK